MHQINSDRRSLWSYLMSLEGKKNHPSKNLYKTRRAELVKTSDDLLLIKVSALFET